MTTDEILRVINNSEMKTIFECIEKSKRMFPEIESLVIFHRQDMGVFGVFGAARFYVGKDEVLIKGYLYPSDSWSEKTHGYVIAKKI